MDANFVAHSMAKFATSYPSILSCNFSSLPDVVWDAWRKDMLAPAF